MSEYIPKIVATIIVFLILPSSKYLIRKILKNDKILGLKSETRITQVIRVINILINFTGIITVAIIWGVKTEDMILAFSTIFAVIGVAMFAQWSILSNVVAGIIIFFSMPFGIGDEISILDKDNPIDATVESILTFVVHLRTAEGELIVLSNTMFLQKAILVKDSK